MRNFDDFAPVEGRAIEVDLRQGQAGVGAMEPETGGSVGGVLTGDDEGAVRAGGDAGFIRFQRRDADRRRVDRGLGAAVADQGAAGVASRT